MNGDRGENRIGVDLVRSCVLVRPRAANRFDLLTGTRTSLSSELIPSTRIFLSRIGPFEEKWLLGRAHSASWHKLAQDGLLIGGQNAKVS